MASNLVDAPLGPPPIFCGECGLQLTIIDRDGKIIAMACECTKPRGTVDTRFICPKCDHTMEVGVSIPPQPKQPEAPDTLVQTPIYVPTPTPAPLEPLEWDDDMTAMVRNIHDKQCEIIARLPNA